MNPSDAFPEVPGYEILQSLGAGSQATVFLARTRDDLEKQVALKVFAASQYRDYEQELHNWRALESVRSQDSQHRLVRGLGAGLLKSGGAFLAMAFHARGSLAELLREAGTLPEQRALAYLRQAAEATLILHGAGLIHRDIKPSNLLLTDADTVCLSDFGLSKRAAAAVSVAGTPGYAAPELYGERPVDDKEALDCYSLGATLHALLTGLPPRPARPDIFALDRAGVSRSTQRLLVAALAFDPAQRCTVAAFLDPQTDISPAPAQTKRGKWAGLLAAGLLSGLLALGLWTWSQAGQGHAPDADTLASGVLPSQPETTPTTTEVKPSATPVTAADSLRLGTQKWELARKLEFGDRVPADFSRALILYREAAALGHDRAMLDLGLIHLFGEGVEQDLAVAYQWFQHAAARGNASAMCNLGVMYNRGDGAAEDPVQAVAWFRKAAELGNPSALYNLANMLSDGRGVAVDDVQAARLMLRSAELGYASAMTAYAAMLQGGIGVQQDLTAAEQWYERAIEAGDEGALALLETLRELRKRLDDGAF